MIAASLSLRCLDVEEHPTLFHVSMNGSNTYDRLHPLLSSNVGAATQEPGFSVVEGIAVMFEPGICSSLWGSLCIRVCVARVVIDPD